MVKTHIYYLLGTVLLFVGLLILVGGFLANSYQSSFLGIPTRVLPIGFGLLLVVVGAVLIFIRKPQEERRALHLRSKSLRSKRCPKCGREYTTLDYCPVCGVKLKPV